MNKYQSFQEFLTTQSIPVSVTGFLINIVVAAVLALLLGKMYTRYGTSLSNRRMFAQNFVLLTTTTMMIISIVKSSLALSLGLVGALSIVRFRAAIKEPEELTYLFLSIAIGLGLGADQRTITLIGFVIIMAIIRFKSSAHRSDESENLYLTVSSHNPVKLDLDAIIKTLEQNCSMVNMKRFDETKEQLEASFLVAFDSIEQLNKAKTELQRQGESVRITFLDNKGIVG